MSYKELYLSSNYQYGLDEEFPEDEILGEETEDDESEEIDEEDDEVSED